MSVIVKNIIPRKFAEATQTTQYTAINCRTVIDKFTATNISANNVTLSVNLVASGEVASSNNLVSKSRVIAPNEAYTFPELIGQVLEPNGVISTIAGTASALTISASGRELTS